MTAKWGLLPALAGFLLAFSAQAQTRLPSVFTVTGVPVDATSNSAAQARDIARAEGERRAFRMLLERLTVKEDWNRLPRVSEADLGDLVQDFEVESERSSAVRYLARLTFRFRPEPVRRLLREARIPFTETRSKPLVVLPVFSLGAAPVLWEEPNPWRAAWAKRPPADGLVPLNLPLGELADLQAIDAERADDGDGQALIAIAQRYEAGDVLVTRATLAGTQDARVLETTTARYSAGIQDQAWTGALKAEANESDGDLLARGVAAVVADVSEAWKKLTLVRSGEAATITVKVPVTSLKDWLVVRDRLEGVPAIQKSRLIALTRDGARVEIHYVGDASQLQLALAQRDLALARGDPDWTLSAKGAAGR